MKRALVPLLFLMAWPHSTHAQGTPSAHDTIPLSPGTRVRLTLGAPELPRLIGWLDQIGPGGLVLAGTALDTLVRVRLSEVERLEVQTERHPRAKGFRVGAVAGSLAGLLGGILIGSAVVEDCSSSDWLCFDDLERGVYGIGGALIGGVLFGALGAVAAGDGWEVVSSDLVGASISPNPSVGSVSLVTWWRPRW